MAGVPGQTREQKIAALQADMRPGDSIMDVPREATPWISDPTIVRAARRDVNSSGLGALGHMADKYGPGGDRQTSRFISGAAMDWYGLDEGGNPTLGGAPGIIDQTLGAGTLPAQFGALILGRVSRAVAEGGSAFGLDEDSPDKSKGYQEMIQGLASASPQWATDAQDRFTKLQGAVRRDMRLPETHGFGQNFWESLGNMAGQVPLPEGALANLASKAKVAPKLLQRLNTATEAFSPTVAPSALSYLSGAGVGAGLETLGEGDDEGHRSMAYSQSDRFGLGNVDPTNRPGEQLDFMKSEAALRRALAVQNPDAIALVENLRTQNHADGGKVSALDKLVEGYLARHGGPYGGNSRKYVDTVRGKMVQVPEKPEELELLDDYSEAPWHWGTSEQDDLKKLISRYAIDLDPEHGLYRGVAAAHPGGAVYMDYTPGRSVQTTTLPVTSVTSNRGEATDFAQLLDDHPDNAVLHLSRKAPIRAMPLPQSGQSEWLLPRPDDWKVTSVQDNPSENVKNVMIDYTQMKKLANGGYVKDNCDGGMATVRSMSHKYAEGGKVGALKAMEDAIAHLDNNDVASAVRTLHASPDALRDPNIAQAVQRLKNPTSVRVGRSALDAAVAADANKMVESTFAKGGMTARTRNALPASKFAGPDRSYPVNDASHAANAKGRAKQQLDRGNLSSSQYSKIMAKANSVLKGTYAKGGKVSGVSDLVRKANRLVGGVDTLNPNMQRAHSYVLRRSPRWDGNFSNGKPNWDDILHEADNIDSQGAEGEVKARNFVQKLKDQS